MKTQWIIALKLLGLFTILLGLAYPLALTGISQVLFPEKANGSLVTIDGQIRGSKWIGQSFDNPAYFSSRPSATNYNPLASGGSNRGLTSTELHRDVLLRTTKFRSENGLSANDTIPSEMVFASGSGLDPHISPEAALLQIDRIVQNRNYTEEQKQKLHTFVEEMAEQPQFHVFGKPRINVLLLNMQLDQIK